MTSPITTPYGPHTTAAEVVDGLDLSGRRVVITGGASGIGRETARALASAGAEVTIAVRDPEAGLTAARRIAQETGTSAVAVRRLDLADLASITDFATTWQGPLDILVNNAGVMALPELRRSPEGWEHQFAVNHLGHAALTLGLADALRAAGSARVVQVASSAHLMAPVDFDDPHFNHRPYEPWNAYAQSKTAVILFATALAGRWADHGVTVNSLHPGGIMTNLQRHLDDGQLAFVGANDEDGNPLAVPPGWKTPEEGAATSVLLAASPLLKDTTGRYFEDCQEAAVVQTEPSPTATGVAPYAIAPEAADRLWTLTLDALSR